MSENSTDRAGAEQERRRAFLEELPDHFCPACTALAYVSEDICFHCEDPRPVTGWIPIAMSGDAWLGRVLADRYLLTRRIATSSRATVYVADSRIIPRSFAIKVMNVSGGPSLDEAGLRRRLRREVEALGTLRNPHIVSFYDVFDVGREHVAFVTDLVRGVTLGELLKDGPLAIDRALELTRQIGAGLFEAHARDLIHRDLKPPNVMVERLPIGDDFVRILDFGVMWVRGTASNTGAFDSIPVFTSPEQVLSEPMDQRSDLYSLGALLFFMLTGQPPFDPHDLQNHQALLVDVAPALEDIVGREFPARVEALVARLLAKDPARRPGDVQEVLGWLDDIAQDWAPLSEVEHGSSEPLAPRSELEAPRADATAMGMIPTLAEPSSPVLQLHPSELSAVSEALVETQHGPKLVACSGEGYAYLEGGTVYWAGAFEGGQCALEPDHDYVAMAVSASRVVLGTSDGRIVLASPGEPPLMAFQDPRLEPMSAVAIVADGGSMIAGSESGRLYMSRGTDFMRMGSGDLAISALCLSRDGAQFGVARGDSIQIMSIGASSLSTFPTPLEEHVICMAFSPDAYLVAVLTDNGTAVLESVHTGQEFMRLDTSDPNLRALSFSAQNHLMGLFIEGDRVVLRALT